MRLHTPRLQPLLVYRDFAMVDTHKTKFVWEKTFAKTMEGFRNAVLAYAQSIKKFLANRKYTKQKNRVPDEALTIFHNLIEFNGIGTSFKLTPEFQEAIDKAKAAAENVHDGRAARSS